MRRNVIEVGLVAVAVACGYLWERSGVPDPGSGRANRETASYAPHPRPSEQPEAAGPIPTAADPVAPPAAGDAVGRTWLRIVGREPTDAERTRIQDAADAERTDLRHRMELAEIAQAVRLGREYIEEQRRLEDAKRGGTMALLRGLGKSAARLPGLVADGDAFSAHFERKTTGPRLDGTSLGKSGEPVPDGATLELPAGVHELERRRLVGPNRKFPRDLLIAGVGMDETLLRLREISPDDEVVSLTFRDLTFDCDNRSLVDLRSRNPATIRLERCRVVGFDSGAGGSVMFDGQAAALYATDCRFEAGYGRHPDGNLFRVRSGFLARLENCVLAGPFRSVFEPDAAATYHFEQCEFRDTRDHLARLRTAAAEGVTFRQCSLIELDDDAGSIPRSLSDINPSWPKRER